MQYKKTFQNVDPLYLKSVLAGAALLKILYF